MIYMLQWCIEGGVELNETEIEKMKFEWTEQASDSSKFVMRSIRKKFYITGV